MKMTPSEEMPYPDYPELIEKGGLPAHVAGTCNVRRLLKKRFPETRFTIRREMPASGPLLLVSWPRLGNVPEPEEVKYLIDVFINGASLYHKVPPDRYAFQNRFGSLKTIRVSSHEPSPEELAFYLKKKTARPKEEDVLQKSPRSRL